MARGEPPGCWVSPELLEVVRAESRAPDKGLAARLERAARMAAVLQGLGYAGAYLGGTHDPRHIAWIIDRAKGLSPRWEEFTRELAYAPKDDRDSRPGMAGYDGSQQALPVSGARGEEHARRR